MPLRIVQSMQNSRLKLLRRAFNRRDRDTAALAAIEGPNLLEEALRAHLTIESIFVAQGAEHLLEPLHLPDEIEVLMLPKELLDAALSTETPQSIAALVKPPLWSWDQIFPERSTAAPLILVLAGLQDPGNLGAIVRSAEAFAARAILCLPGTVSAWNPKAVRASAGSLFRLPLLSVSAEECFSRLRKEGVKILSTAVHGASSADRADLAAPVALVIGNEGSGVPEELAALADAAVTIPCPGPVESLNAAVAAGVLLYEASRQRSLKRSAR